MRILLCALAAILVLGGAGAGAYYYFSGNSAQAADGAEVGDQHDAHKQTAKKAKGGHDAAPSFVELDPLILPIVDNNGVSKIKERLSVLSGKVVGENMISDVLLQVVQQRPI